MKLKITIHSSEGEETKIRFDGHECIGVPVFSQLFPKLLRGCYKFELSFEGNEVEE